MKNHVYPGEEQYNALLLAYQNNNRQSPFRYNDTFWSAEANGDAESFHRVQVQIEVSGPIEVAIEAFELTRTFPDDTFQVVYQEEAKAPRRVRRMRHE